MRIIIYFLFMGLTFVSAQTIELHQQNFNKALNYFNAQKYEKSYELFSQLSQNDLSNKKYNFYLGRSAHELKKYNQAYAAYQRILIQNEKNHRIRLELARVLYDMKLYDDALKEFETVLIYPIPQSVRKNIEFMLVQIKESKKGYHLAKTVLFALGHDDNINNNTHESITRYGTIDLQNDTNKVEDSYHKFIVALNLLYPFENEHYAFENSTLFYIQSFLENHSSDVALIALSNGISYTKNRYKLSWNVLTDKVWYGSDELYQNVGASTTISYLLNNRALVKSELKYQNKSMLQSAESDKDANIYTYSLQLSNSFENGDILNVKSYYKTERKLRGTRIDINKNIYGFSTSYSTKLIPTLTTTFAYGYDNYNYLDDDPILSKRKDTSYTYTLSFNKVLNKQHSIALIGNHSNSQSNIELNRYKKNSIELLYTYSF